MSVDELQSLQIILLFVVPVVCGSKVDFIYLTEIKISASL